MRFASLPCLLKVKGWQRKCTIGSGGGENDKRAFHEAPRISLEGLNIKALFYILFNDIF